MKKIVLLAILSGLGFISCKKQESVKLTNPPPTASLDGHWRMITVKDNISGIELTKPTSVAGNVEIRVSSEGSTKGSFTGETPSNIIGKNEFQTGTNQSISIPVLSMTKVIETEWGNEFVGNIRSAISYSFQNGNLQIVTGNKTLVFQKL
jgi:hypothetical protein